jgi:hypothetical protein
LKVVANEQDLETSCEGGGVFDVGIERREGSMETKKPHTVKRGLLCVGLAALFDRTLGYLLHFGYLGNQDEKNKSGADCRQEVAHNLLNDESRVNWTVAELDSENDSSCPSEELHCCANEIAENSLQHFYSYLNLPYRVYHNTVFCQ